MSTTLLHQEKDPTSPLYVPKELYKLPISERIARRERLIKEKYGGEK